MKSHSQQTVLGIVLLSAAGAGQIAAPRCALPVVIFGDGEGREAIGATRVANEVVASIAALAALQVDGVNAMYQPAGQQIDRILRRVYAHRGVRVLDGAFGSFRHAREYTFRPRSALLGSGR